MKIKTQNWKTIGFLFGLVFVCLAPTILLVTNGLNYLFMAFVAFLSLAFSANMLMRQKRISIYSVMALIVGLLFLASSIIELGYSPFASNLSISEKSELYTILRPQQISLAFSQTGMGIILVLLGYRQITTTSLLPNKHIQVYRMIYLAQISAGISSFISSIYLVINGLYPSARQFYGFSYIGLIAGAICFGLLALWYMVLQPFIARKMNKVSLNDKSA